jgi:hypothetical protein
MAALPHDPDLVLQSLDGIAIRPVVWFWPGRLARGKLAMFDGDPGLGKSLVTMDLCARVSTGRPFPDGSPGQPPANVLIFQGEDSAEDVINPRLDALGADRARVFQVQRRRDFGPEPICFPAHLHLLEEALRLVRPLLVVIDPIMAFLDTTITVGNDASVRRVLTPLSQLAEKYDCVVILVRHLTKNTTKRSIYRGAGSMAFLAACRSAWLFARYPGKASQAVIAQVKNNLAPPQISLAYEMVTRPNDVPELRWNGTCNLSDADLHKWADRIYPARLRARDFLNEILKDGPRPSKLIWAEALKLGLSKSTLNRAKKTLPIRFQRTVEGKHDTYYWFLEGHKAPLSSDPDIRAFEERLEAQRAQLPERNPLDEPEIS